MSPLSHHRSSKSSSTNAAEGSPKEFCHAIRSKLVIIENIEFSRCTRCIKCTKSTSISVRPCVRPCVHRPWLCVRPSAISKAMFRRSSLVSLCRLGFPGNLFLLERDKKAAPLCYSWKAFEAACTFDPLRSSFAWIGSIRCPWSLRSRCPTFLSCWIGD
jgi:hypothetical protein